MSVGVAAVVAAILGAIVGSFLNVVAYRLPRGESLLHPPSACPSCGTPIKPYDNVPVLGWLWLRGQVPRVRGADLAAVPDRRGRHRRCCAPRACCSFGADRDVWLPLVFVLLLVPITLIDLDHHIIPNVLIGDRRGRRDRARARVPERRPGRAPDRRARRRRLLPDRRDRLSRGHGDGRRQARGRDGPLPRARGRARDLRRADRRHRRRRGRDRALRRARRAARRASRSAPGSRSAASSACSRATRSSTGTSTPSRRAAAPWGGGPTWFKAPCGGADTRSDESRQPPSSRHARRLQGLRRARRRPGGQGRRGRVRRPRRARRLRRRRRGLRPDRQHHQAAHGRPRRGHRSASRRSQRQAAQLQAVRRLRRDGQGPRRRPCKRPRRLALRLGAGRCATSRAPSRPTSR